MYQFIFARLVNNEDMHFIKLEKNESIYQCIWPGQCFLFHAEVIATTAMPNPTIFANTCKFMLTQLV